MALWHFQRFFFPRNIKRSPMKVCCVFPNGQNGFVYMGNVSREKEKATREKKKGAAHVFRVDPNFLFSFRLFYPIAHEWGACLQPLIAFVAILKIDYQFERSFMCTWNQHNTHASDTLSCKSHFSRTDTSRYQSD